MTKRLVALLWFMATIVGLWAPASQAAEPLSVLFLGDKGHHRPADLAGRLIPALRKKGIELTYTEEVGSLHPDKLKDFDGLLIYANIDQIEPDQEKALLDFVASGKGFIPIHCATYCFRNSPEYIALCGAQFQSHGGEEFETVIVAPEHPVMQGFDGFRSWDETYVHHMHNTKDRTVLEVRRQGGQARGNKEEPWTWVRTHGKGRVFYTAWGHDTRTWQQEGFVNLVERGIRWACGKDPAEAGAYVDASRFPIPAIQPAKTDVAEFTYRDVGAQIPNYRPGERWGTQGKPLNMMQEPLSPEESQKHYRTPVDFTASLWASEPMFQGKPIAMNWDERGRLWVCETVDYPNELQPEGKGRDRIRIVEDSDGDGVADRSKVFAERLSIPTAIVIYRGGALVQDGQTTIYLKDLNGDDVADIRQELITGWGIGDTHGGVSNFQYAMDGWIWAMQGYNDSQPVINGQPQQAFRQGFWRFRVEPGKPDPTAPVEWLGEGKPVESEIEQSTLRVREVEFIRATNNNTWGLGFSEEGLVFGSTANANPSNFMPIPNRYYERVKGWAPSTLAMISDSNKFQPVTDKVRQVDVHGGYTAAAGHSLYTARQYPKSWWNRIAFVCEPTGHLVGSFVLNRDGAGYRSTNPFNLIASDDEWASPIMAEVGPDGNMWVIDWYNYIVQHNPTPQGFKTGRGNAYETELRDKKHGRIYRVLYEGEEAAQSALAEQASKLASRGLGQLSSEQLVAVLSHPTMRRRLDAQRLLEERQDRSPAVVAALLNRIATPAVDAIGIDAGAMHALHVLRSLDLIQPQQKEVFDAVLGALSHPAAGVRRNAIQVLPADPAAVAAIAPMAMGDSDPQVCLAALLHQSDAAAVDQGAQVLASVDESIAGDRWLLDAWTSAASIHAARVLPLLVQRETIPLGAMQRLKIVGEHLARTSPDAKAIGALMQAMAKGNSEARLTILEGLFQGWPEKHAIELDGASADALLSVLEQVPIGSKSMLAQLASRWGGKSMAQQLKKIGEELFGLLSNADADLKLRVEAAQQLVALQPSEGAVVSQLMEQVTPQTPPTLVLGILGALVQSRAAEVGALIVDKAPELTPDARSAAIRTLMARPETTRFLLDAIGDGKLQLADLSLDQKQALRDHPDEAVRKAATELLAMVGGVPNANRQKVLEEWMPLTEQEGSVAQGKAVFTKHCSLCHQHSGEGQAIGPDLTGMAVHPKHELLTHILDPNRSVEGNFRTYTVLTGDGLVLTGMLAGESKTSIELINTQGKRETLQREEIEKITASSKSLMPEGFEGQMKQEEMRDLLEFLTSKGKYVPLPLGKVATAISTKGLFHDGDDGPDRMRFDDWKPKVFQGVPFVLVDPQGKQVPNIVLLNGPLGTMPPKMPKEVSLICNAPAAKIHLLSGISGWGFPAVQEKSVSMIVRLVYADGQTEDHPLQNGVHFSDYIRRIDVPQSQFAFDLKGQQLRYLAIEPKRQEPLKELILVKGNDDTAPIVMAVTLESPGKE